MLYPLVTLRGHDFMTGLECSSGSLGLRRGDVTPVPPLFLAILVQKSNGFLAVCAAGADCRHATISVGREVRDSPSPESPWDFPSHAVAPSRPFSLGPFARPRSRLGRRLSAAVGRGHRYGEIIQ